MFVKARLPVSKEMLKRAKQFALDETERQQKDATRRLIKLTIVALRKVYGFGFKRALRFVRELYKLIDESASDEIFWYHTDKLIIDQLGLDFEREDYEEVDK